MESIVEQLRLKDIDKSTWKKYRFDQIAKNISERVEPSKTDLEIYVGLEHIDSESIHVKRIGKREDVNGTKLRCYPGDVIFGRRRAYQRKAAIVEFDGFCSAHSLVLRANSDVIHPKLFPFFLHSDTFMHRSVDISVGSLSPTINWGDLKKQEFILPPKDQQEQIAELLWALDEVIEKENIVLERLEAKKLTTTESLLTGKTRVINHDNKGGFKKSKLGLIPSSWRLYHLKDILSKTRLGGNYANSEEVSSIPLIKMGNLSRGYINLDKIFYIPNEIDYNSDDLLREGDLLFNTRNTLELVGKVAIWKNELPKALYNSNILKLEFKKDIVQSNDFMNMIFNSRKGIQQLRSFATGTTSVAAIYTPELMRFCCAIPSLIEQEKIVEKIEAIRRSILLISSKISSSKQLQKTLINQIF